MRLWTRAAILGGMAVCFAFALVTQAANPILASKHNMNVAFGAGTIREGQVCLPCHTPHNMNPAYHNEALWNHTMDPSKAYQLYTSGGKSTRYAANYVGLDNSSRMCLSCHDGAVAVDSFGGSTPSAGNPANVVGAGFNVGFNADLTRDHPVGVRYPGAQMDGTWVSAGGYKDSTTLKTAPAGVSALGGGAVKLFKYETDADTAKGTVVGCASCHTPHDNAYKFLRIPNTNSDLCLKCHDK